MNRNWTGKHPPEVGLDIGGSDEECTGTSHEMLKVHVSNASIHGFSKSFNPVSARAPNASLCSRTQKCTCFHPHSWLLCTKTARHRFVLVRNLSVLFDPHTTALPQPGCECVSSSSAGFFSLCAPDQDVVHGDVYCTPCQPFASSSFRPTLRPHIIFVHEVTLRVYILSLTTYPITPMIKKPIPTAWEMRRNSRRSAVSSVSSSSSRTFPLSRPHLSGSSGGGGRRRFGNVRLEHRVINCLPSLRNSRGISRSSFVWSIVAVVLRLVAAEW